MFKFTLAIATSAFLLTTGIDALFAMERLDDWDDQLGEQLVTPMTKNAEDPQPMEHQQFQQQPIFLQNHFGQFNQNNWYAQPPMQYPNMVPPSQIATYPLELVQTPNGPFWRQTQVVQRYFPASVLSQNQMGQIPAFAGNPLYAGGMKRLHEPDYYPDKSSEHSYSDDESSEDESSSSQNEEEYFPFEQQIGRRNAQTFITLEKRISQDLYKFLLLDRIVIAKTGYYLPSELKEMIFFTFQLVRPGYKLDLCGLDFDERRFYNPPSPFSKILITIPPFLYRGCLTSMCLSEADVVFAIEWMAQCANLTHLDLRGNAGITNAGITNAGIQGLTNLVSLNLENNAAITDEGIQGLTNLTDLHLGGNARITNAGIQGRTNLTRLNLENNAVITDQGIQELPNLICLNLDVNHTITDKGIKGLTNLICLNLDVNRRITDEGIKGLTNLKSLSLSENHLIRDGGIQGLTNLTFLNVAFHNITDAAIQGFTKLTSLVLRGNEMITDAGIQAFTNLTSLDISMTNAITNAGIQGFTKLTSLILAENGAITDAGIQEFTNLTLLNLDGFTLITDEGIQGFTKLTSLGLGDICKITDKGIQGLTNLTRVNLEGNEVITDDVLRHLGLSRDRLRVSFY